MPQQQQYWSQMKGKRLKFMNMKKKIIVIAFPERGNALKLQQQQLTIYGLTRIKSS